MKISGIETLLMQASAPRDDAWATDNGGHQVSARNWLFVRVSTDAGVCGIGECSGWPRVVDTAVNDLARVLIGEDPEHIEKLWHKMYVAQMGHGLTGTVGAGAIAGLDMALWDIKGKVLDTPIWNLLGGQVRDRIRIYAHASSPDVARALVSSGITAVKTGGVTDPLRKVESLREAVGDNADIMVDLHGPPWLTAKDAVVLGRALEPSRLLFLEEPVAPENLDGLTRVGRDVAIPLAAGERVANIWGWRSLIEHGVDIVQPDAGRAGITQMKKLAALAEAHGVMVAPHSGSLGPVAEFAAVHVLASIPNALILERIQHDWPVRERVISSSLKVENGCILVPTEPGLGVDLDEAEIALYPSTSNVAVARGGHAPGTESEYSYTQTRLDRKRYFSSSRRDQEEIVDLNEREDSVR